MTLHSLHRLFAAKHMDIRVKFNGPAHFISLMPTYRMYFQIAPIHLCNRRVESSYYHRHMKKMRDIWLFIMQASTLSHLLRYRKNTLEKDTKSNSFFQNSWRAFSTLQQSCYQCLVKADTKYDRISLLPDSPFHTIHGARFVLASIGELGGVVIACQLLHYAGA